MDGRPSYSCTHPGLLFIFFLDKGFMAVYPTRSLKEKTRERAAELERGAQMAVSRSLSAIEVALSEWDAGGKKPAGLEPTMRYLRRSHDLLSAWERESVSGKRDAVSRFLRLKVYVALCRKLDSERPG